MKPHFWKNLIAVFCACLVLSQMPDHANAFQRGGRGGGGRIGGGGGGGRIGGGGGGISRPAGGGGGISRPSGGAVSRPSVGSSPSFSRPNTSRPAVGGGAGRPSASPGNRPGAGIGAANRPSTLPSVGLGGGNRPPIQSGNRPGTRPSTGIGSGAGIAGRPGTGVGSGAGIGSRPGTGIGSGSRPSTLPGTRPGLAAGIGAGAATLPGLGAGNAGSRLPNQGANLQDRMANRPQTLEDRRSDLNNRLTGGREDWQQHRNDMQNDRQDWRDNNREDWQNFADDHRGQYGDWYHDCWHDGNWNPGDGWDYMWDNYPVMSAFGVTRWGVNRLAYGFGYWGYSNPYVGGSYSSGSYGYDYSAPLVSYSDTAAAAPTDAAPADAAAPQEPDEGLAAFDQARTAFFGGDYEGALKLLETTLKTRPNDTVVHEFRGLVLFALKKYPEASAAIYAVLSAGPGWDWTTMSGLYPTVDVYSEQLRALENFVTENPKSPDGTFLLGYHYLTMGHKEEAEMQFAAALALLPGDKLLTQLAGDQAAPATPPRETPSSPPPAKVVPPDKVLSVEKLAGNWEASSADAKFELKLAADSTFVWTYSRGTSTQSVKGVFATDQDTLAMEPDAGGTMLAEIDLKSPTSFHFTMMGGEANDPGLQFAKKD